MVRFLGHAHLRAARAIAASPSPLVARDREPGQRNDRHYPSPAGTAGAGLRLRLLRQHCELRPRASAEFVWFTRSIEHDVFERDRLPGCGQRPLCGGVADGALWGCRD